MLSLFSLFFSLFKFLTDFKIQTHTSGQEVGKKTHPKYLSTCNDYYCAAKLTSLYQLTKEYLTNPLFFNISPAFCCKIYQKSFINLHFSVNDELKVSFLTHRFTPPHATLRLATEKAMALRWKGNGFTLERQRLFSGKPKACLGTPLFGQRDHVLNRVVAFPEQGIVHGTDIHHRGVWPGVTESLRDDGQGHASAIGHARPTVAHGVG